jgi:hypothetical protein
MRLSFPQHEVVGEVEWRGGAADATGTVDIPDGAAVTLYISADEPVALGFMRRLPSDVIAELHVQGPLVSASFNAVTHLADGLRYLHLVGTDLGDEALHSVAQLRGLFELHCLGNNFSGYGLRRLTVLHALEYICLEQDGLSVSDLEFVTSLPHLRRLTCLRESGLNETELSRLRAMLPRAEVD